MRMDRRSLIRACVNFPARRRRRRFPIIAVLGMASLGLSACVSGPIEVDALELDVRSPAEVARQSVNLEAPSEPTPPEGTASAASAAVLWGGILVSSTNLDGETRFDVLAYPLSRRQRPMIGRPPEGRFRVLVDGYVETLDYAEGRQVTILGSLDGVVDGKVGEATRRFPVVRARQLHLWRPGVEDDRPKFTFGLGIGISN